MDNMAIRILRHATEIPDQIATQSGTVSLTYAELEEQARKAASALKERGVSEGSVVGIALRDGQQTVVANLGIWLVGGTCNLIDFRTSGSEKKSLSETYNHVLILEDRNQSDDDYPGLSLSQWTKEVAAAPMAQGSPAANDSLAYLSFTSGTTGIPATLEISHEALHFRAACLTDAGFDHIYTRYLNTGPMSFGGTQAMVINSLAAGGTVIFFPYIFQLRDLAEAFAKHQITGCALMPTTLRDLLAYIRETGETIGTPDAPPWLVAHGAAIQPSELLSIRDILSPNVLQIYASHPVGTVTFLDLGKEPAKVDTVGRPRGAIEVEIVDQDDKPVPPMTVGQIRVRAPGRVAPLKGRSNELGADYFLGDWYYPCDLGLLDVDGYLKLMGRSTEVIIRGGVNVYPQEVEAVVSDLPGVRQVAAVGYPDERAGEEIALFAVVDQGVDAKELHRHCKARLTADKCPKRILIVPEIPLNANGKIARRKLSRMV